jgi:hypothetical protein
MLSRRGFIGSLLAAPVIIRTPGLLMPIKPPLVLRVVDRPFKMTPAELNELHRQWWRHLSATTQIPSHYLTGELIA